MLLDHHCVLSLSLFSKNKELFACAVPAALPTSGSHDQLHPSATRKMSQRQERSFTVHHETSAVQPSYSAFWRHVHVHVRLSQCGGASDVKSALIQDTQHFCGFSDIGLCPTVVRFALSWFFLFFLALPFPVLF